jgi:tetratricopeptide (TPR) repeat protein
MQEIRNKERIETGCGRLVCGILLAFSLIVVALIAFQSEAAAAPSALKSTPAVTGKSDVPENNPAIEAMLFKLEDAIEKENFFEADELMKSVPSVNIAREPRLLVGKALIAKGMYKLDESYNLLRAALKIDKDFAPAQYEIALILMEKKDWRDAEVLLRLAGTSDLLKGQRKILLPYYLGVIAFETGRLFEARSSFLRLNWNESLDPAVEQSMTAFVSKISKQRPWNVIAPVSWQYDTNLIALPDSAALPAAYSRKGGAKVIAGVFGNLEGLSFAQAPNSSFGLGTRFFAVQHFEKSFRSLDVQFFESELNWTRLLGPELGIFKLGTSINFVRADERPLSSTFAVRGNLKNTELSLGYEGDLQKTSTTNRSSLLVRLFREQSLLSKGGFSLSLPAETGGKFPMATSPAEARYDLSLTPSLGFAPSKRWNLKFTEKLKMERVKSASQPAFFLTQSSTGLNFSMSVQPYLVTSAGVSYDWEKNQTSGDVVSKSTVSLSLLGML